MCMSHIISRFYSKKLNTSMKKFTNAFHSRRGMVGQMIWLHGKVFFFLNFNIARNFQSCNKPFSCRTQKIFDAEQKKNAQMNICIRIGEYVCTNAAQ